MMRKTLTSALLMLALAGVSAPGHAFEFFGLFAKNDLKDMLPYVPADTPLFLGGTADPDLIEDLYQWTTPGLMSEAGTEVEQIFSGLPQTPGLAFAREVMLDFYADNDESLEQRYQRYGYGMDGASVFYMDGIFPVIRVALDDEAALWETLQAQAQEAGYDIRQQPLNDKTLRTFELVNEDGLTLHLGLLTARDTLTISVFTPKDDDAALAQRFALAKPAQALTQASWTSLGDTYDFDDQFRGYMHLVHLAQMFLKQDSTAAQQMNALLPDGVPGAGWPQVCREETINMISGAPRIVFGSQSIQMQDDKLDMALLSAWEIDNSDIRNDLSALRGFLPSYVTDNEQVSLGFALGLDMDSLVPSLSSLWNRFIQADYECEAWQNAQVEVQQLNPAVLSLVAGFGQGVKGLSVGLFNLNVSEALEELAADVLVTVSAEKPSVIASLLTSYVPSLQGQVIPQDGTPVKLSVPMLPFQPEIAIKNKHLVLYSGEQARAEADKLSQIELSRNGLTALTIDYRLMGELILNGATALTQYQEQLAQGNDCTELYVSGLAMKNLDMRLSGSDTITDRGLVSRYRLRMNPTVIQSQMGDVAGDYEIDMLNDECSWESIGQESLNSDGTGLFTQLHASGSCGVFESSYEWTKGLAMIEQTNTSSRYREDCNAVWQDTESFDFNCTVLASDDTGFYCLNNTDGENMLYRYTER